MASTHEKMQTDYLWVKDHTQADSAPQARTHGYNYLYYHAPNKRERLEMMYRSVGKQYDWELEKFRLSKKGIDKGNKRRLIKNFFRLLKHPMGYIFWKTYKYRTAKGRFMVTAMGFGLILALCKYKQQSYRNAKKNAFILASGQNIDGNRLASIGYQNQQFAKQAMPLTGILFHELMGSKIVVSPCRDQNFRKYFEMRKKYDIKA